MMKSPFAADYPPGGRGTRVKEYGTIVFPALSKYLRSHHQYFSSHRLPIPEDQDGRRFKLLLFYTRGFGSDWCLTAVDFDDQVSIGAKEVDDEAIDRELSPKFPSAKTAIARAKPRRALGIRLITTQSPRGAGACLHRRAPSPRPSPCGRGSGSCSCRRAPSSWTSLRRRDRRGSWCRNEKCVTPCFASPALLGSDGGGDQLARCGVVIGSMKRSAGPLPAPRSRSAPQEVLILIVRGRIPGTMGASMPRSRRRWR